MKKIFTLCLTILFFGVSLLTAQQRQVSGTVTSADDGEPIVGATVMIVGTTTGATTNIEGKFHFPNVPQGAQELSISYLGAETVTVPIQSVVNVALASSATAIGEVVVTGMGKMDRRIFTGATDQLSGDAVKLDGVADISRALEGRSAGVSVQNVSGTFGTAPKIRVRGATSILGSSRPLWVVDGIILEDAVDVSADALSSGDAVTLISSAVAGLNPDDIESFSILKDGSATSIYGARAMAGVVVITTKRGKAGVSTINYTGEFSMRLVPTYNQFNIMNSQDQMAVYLDMRDKGHFNLAESARSASSGVFGKMYQLMSVYDKTNGQWGMENTEVAKNRFLKAAEMRNTDWFKELFAPSIVQNHAVSISSGNERSRYYTSMSAMYDPGWTKASSVNRYTLNVNGSFDIFKNFTLNMIGNASYRRQKAPGTLQRNTNDVTGSVSRDFDINPYSYAINSSRTLDPDEYYTRNWAPFNIKNELDNNYMDLAVADMKYQAELRWKPIQGLEVSALAAVKYNVTNQDHVITENSNQAMTYRAGVEDQTIADRNNWLYTDPSVINSLPQVVLPEGGILDKRVYKMFGYDFRTMVEYNKTFDGQHIVNFLGGMEVSSIDRNQSYNRGWGYQYNNGGIPFYSYLVFKKGIEQNDLYYDNLDTRVRNAAFFANPTYSWKGIYTLNGTIRYEGSNAFGKSRKSRWLPTWNISGAWNAHEEQFFKNSLSNIMSHLKLRLSYSLTADRGPSSVANSMVIYESITAWRPVADLQEAAIRIRDLENSELTYEKKREFNVGLDLGFLDNRINLSTDIYTRNNFDLIGLAYTPGAGGQIAKLANVATMKSHGVEFTLSTRNIETRDFKWSTDFTFSWAKNEITDLETESSVMQLISGSGYAQRGYPVRALFSIPYLGLTEDGLPLFINQDNVETITDINFQETLNKDYLKYEGPTDPTITGGFGNIFTYKNFRLNIFMTYSFGNVIRLDPFYSDSYDDLAAMPKEFKNRWLYAGDEKKTDVPVILARQDTRNRDYVYAYNAYNYSTHRVAKGDFIRMKEISLSYDFDKELLQKIKMRSLQVKVQATNPFLIYADSKLNGQDPEFFRAGGVAVPMAKQFTLTLRIGF